MKNYGTVYSPLFLRNHGTLCKEIICEKHNPLETQNLSHQGNYNYKKITDISHLYPWRWGLFTVLSSRFFYQQIS
ncbi:unnamed protein product [Allacma fusca]|uniref:Uncharacterized protein n=1 Tax=Allacma fusca TaxID=39272 RepID=A0A8J2LBP8_9HEXA|nr:unnamed protein product [Allacma fusca]